MYIITQRTIYSESRVYCCFAKYVGRLEASYRSMGSKNFNCYLKLISEWFNVYKMHQSLKIRHGDFCIELHVIHMVHSI
jgi:hypothetical protein